MNPFRRYLSLFAFTAMALVPLTSQVPLAPGVRIAHPDHHEFEAALWAPFMGEQGEARTFKVGFGFVDAETMTVGSWRLELVDAKGLVRRTWHGESFLVRGTGSQRIAWNGVDASGHILEHGFYTLRLTAKPMAQADYRHYPGGSQMDRVEAHLATSTEEAATQETTICVGPAPRVKVRALDMPVGSTGLRGALAPGSAPAPGSLPYTIYLGNLHSQTNHSDGGVVVTSCAGSEDPQAGTQGPAQAYEMMRVNAGGDFLAATEHNHMYDGTTGTGNLDPAIPKALFDSGVAAASAYRTANPTFQALYGVEWGVISNGGHLNIFNPDGLPTWEFNASSQLMGHFNTPKNDYPALYLTMQSRNWVGQFNHPQTSQFNGLTYTAAGDEVMALCEVSNSGAFSTSLTESDPFLSNFEITFNAILEKGFHVSPTSNQDNHCANWGLSNINRTGILVPNGTPWTYAAMLDAIRARRTFATHDKGSQIVLTTFGGAMMGDRINNSGSLTLQVHFATTSPGQTLPARIQIFEGIPGTAFSTVQMIEGTDTATITPAGGNHFYYAKIMQPNGRFLWSAPIWVNQAVGPVAANITVPAVNTTVQDGTTVNFTGTATTTNGSIVSHAWDFGDGQIGTGASPSHLFTNTDLPAANIVRTVTYTATDNLGFTGQATRLITVQPFGVTNTNPTISDIPNQSTLKDMPINNLGFTIGDVETNANLLTITGSSSNQTLLPDANITFGGSGTSRTISMAPAADQTGTSTVTVTVVDSAGASATDTFIFSVGTLGAGGAKLIISQYYEGTSNNKWIEITNVGGSTYDANDVGQTPLYLQTWSNPPLGTTFGSWLIDGTLAAGATRTYRHNSAVIPAAGNITGTPIAVTSGTTMEFNGNDATYITPLSTAGASAYAARLDAIGDENNAAGGWANGTGLGLNKSFYRNATVISPSAIYTPSEWTLAALATVDSAATGTTQRLGEHIFNNPATISDIAGQTIEANQQAGPVNFTVSGNGTLTVTATSDNALLLPNANLVLTGSGTDTARTITATPVPDQVGTAIITVTVTDGAATTASDTFVLTVTEPNSTITGVSVAPVDPTVNGLSTTTFTATVTGTGSFSQAVNWSATGGSINALGQWTAPNTVGPFTITATSVQNGAVSGSSSATVVPINTNPTISDITNKTTVQDTAIANIPFTVGDAETPLASLTVGATSSNTTLIPNANLTFGGSGASRTLTVTPAAGQTGTSTITVTVTDGGTATATDTFVVTVTPPPSMVIISQYYEGASFNKFIEITNLGTSTINLASPQLYIVAINYSGTGGGADPATVAPGGSFLLTGSLAPGASRVYRHRDAALPVYANIAGINVGTTAVNFNGNDIVFLSTSTATGTGWNNRLDVAGNNLGWVGQDRSLYRKPTVLGGNMTFDLAGEWILAGTLRTTPPPTPPNDIPAVDTALSTQTEYLGTHLFGAAPTISDMTDLIVEMNTAIPGIPFTVNDAETNPDNLVFTLTSSNTTLLPNAGITVSGTGTSRTLDLAPTAGQRGTTTVTVSIKDHGNMVASDTFVLTVNAPPVATDQSVSTNEDTALPITLAATDPDGNPMTYTVTGGPAHGSLTGIAPNLTYTPAGNYNGPDSFTFTANDGRVDSSTATVSITVDPVNDAPVATGEAYVLVAGTTLMVSAPGVLGNDTDVDSPALSAVLVSGPAHGSMSLALDGSFTYTPYVAYSGPDSFTYQANDGAAASNIVTVNLTINLAGAPRVTSFSPNAGPVGTLVNLTGSNFAGLTSVKFNGVSAAFTILSPTQVQAIVSAGTTTGPISVSNGLGTGTTTVAFTVTSNTPRITSFSPTSGPVGTVVTIAGSNFAGTTTVKFNGVNAVFTLVSGTQIKATVPVGATTGPISVTTGTGTGTTGTVKFTVR